MTPILFSELEALGVIRAVNMFIGIHHVSFPITLFDHCAPFFRGRIRIPQLYFVKTTPGTPAGSIRGRGFHVLSSRSIAQQMINSRRAVVAGSVMVGS